MQTIIEKAILQLCLHATQDYFLDTDVSMTIYHVDKQQFFF